MHDARVVILPILFDLTISELLKTSPSLAGKYAALWSDGVSVVADHIEQRIRARPREPVSMIPEEIKTNHPTPVDVERASAISKLVAGVFEGEAGGALLRDQAEAVATAILSGGNLLVTASEHDMDRAVRVARRVGGLLNEDRGPPFLLTSAMAATRGLEITGGPTVTTSRKFSRNGELFETFIEKAIKPALVPTDVSVVVLADITKLNRSALEMMRQLLGSEYGGGTRSMNVWGTRTQLPNLRSMVMIADRDQLISAGMSASFRYQIDVVVDVSRNDDDRDSYLRSLLSGEVKDESELRGSPVGPPVIGRGEFDTFEATASEAYVELGEIEAALPALNSLCEQADWAFTGLAWRCVNTAKTRAAVARRRDVTVDDIEWAAAMRAASVGAFTGKCIELP